LKKTILLLVRAVGNQMTLKDIEEYAFDEIDKLIKEEEKI
jgi:hypothetical protein